MREPKIKNEIYGEYWAMPIFECDCCGGDMVEWVEVGDKFYCPDCAFKDGLIGEKEYLDKAYYWADHDDARAVVVDGEIYVAFKHQKFPWEKTNKDYRQSKEYKDWRESVFVRDGFKCQICGQIGGELNAHHIKTFKDHPALRFDVNNGITLCAKCHRELHKRLRNGDKTSSRYGLLDR